MLVFATLLSILLFILKFFSKKHINFNDKLLESFIFSVCWPFVIVIFIINFIILFVIVTLNLLLTFLWSES